MNTQIDVLQPITLHGQILEPGPATVLTADVERLVRKGFARVVEDSASATSRGLTPLEIELLTILEPYADETGADEGPVEVVNRLIRERDEARTELSNMIETTRINESVARAGTRVDSGTPAETQGDPLAALKPLGPEVVAELVKASFDTPEKIRAATNEQLDAVPGIGVARIKEIRTLLGA